MKTTKINALGMMAIAVVMFATFDCLGQEPAGKGPMDKDPMREFFFPPELVMRYQNDIQLKKEQKEQIIVTMEEAQKKFNRLQWDLQNEMSLLQKLLAEPMINETKALEQLDKVLDQERLIKKGQITLMLRVKNSLTDDQKTKLNALKGK